MQMTMSFLPELSSPMSLLAVYVFLMMCCSVFINVACILMLRIYHKPKEEKVIYLIFYYIGLRLTLAVLWVLVVVFWLVVIYNGILTRNTSTTVNSCTFNRITFQVTYWLLNFKTIRTARNYTKFIYLCFITLMSTLKQQQKIMNCANMLKYLFI